MKIEFYEVGLGQSAHRENQCVWLWQTEKDIQDQMKSIWYEQELEGNGLSLDVRVFNHSQPSFSFVNRIISKNFDLIETSRVKY